MKADWVASGGPLAHTSWQPSRAMQPMSLPTSQTGLQQQPGNATLLFYLTEAGCEGRTAFVEKRKPDFRKFKCLP